MQTQRDAFIKELKILSKINQSTSKEQTSVHVPKIISYKSNSKYSEILLNDVGLDLTHLLCSEDSDPSLDRMEIGLNMGLQMVKALEIIHNCGYLH